MIALLQQPHTRQSQFIVFKILTRSRREVKQKGGIFMKVYGIIYLLIDGTNDMEYVGQTTRTLKVRFYQHMHDNLYVDRVIQEHGKENFTTAILKVCYNQEELDYWEKHFIKYRDTIAPNCYNLAKGGSGTGGENNPFFGKHHTKTALKKMSEMKIGKSNPFFGKHHTKKTLIKMVVASHRKTAFKNLLAEMDRRKMSYRELGEILNLSNGTISDKMQGTLKFTTKDITKLTKIFGLSAEHLLKRDDGKNAMAKRYGTPFKNLIYEIDKKEISYTILAELLSISLASVSMKMHGKRNFTTKDIEKLVEIFGKPAEYLMQRDED